MATNIFLDTNILIDYTLRREFELTSTDRIFELAEDKRLNLFVSESVITTTFYFLEKNKIDGLAIVRELSPLLNIVPLKNDIFFSQLEYFKEKEDGILYFMAAKANLNYFITRNIKHFKFQLPSLPVITPNNFMQTQF